ncbi:MAG TPA: 50S ribosomal protein L35 [Candidatus Omnitrophica bacterium]|nr:50S ribosomal protein L35 [Candidatus Omnitrophota bacterium]
MPKLKTKKSAAKRFKYSSSGKIKRNKANKSHLLSKKSSDRKRRLSRKDTIDLADKPRIKRLIPYR